MLHYCRINLYLSETLYLLKCQHVSAIAAKAFSNLDRLSLKYNDPSDFVSALG